MGGASQSYPKSRLHCISSGPFGAKNIKNEWQEFGQQFWYPTGSRTEAISFISLLKEPEILESFTKSTTQVWMHGVCLYSYQFNKCLKSAQCEPRL